MWQGTEKSEPAYVVVGPRVRRDNGHVPEQRR
jgi:hypothetical protein